MFKDEKGDAKRKKPRMVHKALQSGTQDVEAVPVPYVTRQCNNDICLESTLRDAEIFL
jgi:hypothetical protein